MFDMVAHFRCWRAETIGYLLYALRMSAVSDKYVVTMCTIDMNYRGSRNFSHTANSLLIILDVTKDCYFNDRRHYFDGRYALNCVSTDKSCFETNGGYNPLTITIINDNSDKAINTSSS